MTVKMSPKKECFLDLICGVWLIAITLSYILMVVIPKITEKF